MRENWVQSRGWKDILEKEMALQWGKPTPVFLPGGSMDRGAWLAIAHEVAKSWI